MLRMWICLTVFLGSSVAYAQEDPVAHMYGNTIITYSGTGAVYRSHRYRDHKFVMERPSGTTIGTWRVDDKGFFCATQVTPPRDTDEHCYDIFPAARGKKPGDVWYGGPNEPAHHYVMVAGDVFAKPAPKSDPMHGYYDNVFAWTDDSGTSRRIYFNPENSVLEKRGKDNLWGKWFLKDAKTVCIYPYEGKTEEAVCQDYAAGKEAGDTWQHHANGKAYAAKMVKGRP